MSQPTEPKTTPTSEEVVDELTKHLESECTVNQQNSEPKSDETQKEPYIPEDFDKSDGEEETDTIPTVPDDYVDEEAMKEAEANLTDEERLQRQKDSLDLKNKGNEEFRNGQYLESISTYTEGLRLCPLTYESDRAILYSNRAASKIQLERKQSAIDDCSKSIELNQTYLKAYVRRAKLYEEIDKLDESLEDWKKVLELDAGNSEAKTATVRLPPKINERNEKLKTEMMGKLKDLGNMFLRPFGLSTENFKLQQDPSTGGYSVNFQKE